MLFSRENKSIKLIIVHLVKVLQDNSILIEEQGFHNSHSSNKVLDTKTLAYMDKNDLTNFQKLMRYYGDLNACQRKILDLILNSGEDLMEIYDVATDSENEMELRLTPTLALVHIDYDVNVPDDEDIQTGSICKSQSDLYWRVGPLNTGRKDKREMIHTRGQHSCICIDGCFWKDKEYSFMVVSDNKDVLFGTDDEIVRHISRLSTNDIGLGIKLDTYLTQEQIDDVYEYIDYSRELNQKYRPKC